MSPYLKFTLLAFAGEWPLLACAVPQASQTLAASEPGGGGLQVIFGLLLVALLLAATLYLLKRLAAPRATGVLLRVISAISLGPRERVVIVEAGETWLVLGVAPGQVNKLHELPRQTMVETSLPYHRSVGPDFATRLKQFMDARHAR
jgi:flagellar protein FliO/FliZ